MPLRKEVEVKEKKKKKKSQLYAPSGETTHPLTRKQKLHNEPTSQQDKKINLGSIISDPTQTMGSRPRTADSWGSWDEIMSKNESKRPSADSHHRQQPGSSYALEHHHPHTHHNTHHSTTPRTAKKTDDESEWDSPYTSPQLPRKQMTMSTNAWENGNTNEGDGQFNNHLPGVLGNDDDGKMEKGNLSGMDGDDTDDSFDIKPTRRTIQPSKVEKKRKKKGGVKQKFTLSKKDPVESIQEQNDMDIAHEKKSNSSKKKTLFGGLVTKSQSSESPPFSTTTSNHISNASLPHLTTIPDSEASHHFSQPPLYPVPLVQPSNSSPHQQEAQPSTFQAELQIPQSEFVYAREENGNDKRCINPVQHHSREVLSFEELQLHQPLDARTYRDRSTMDLYGSELESSSRAVVSAFFSVLRTFVDILLSIVFEFFTFVLYIARKIFVEFVELFGDVFFKPFLQVLYNKFLHPIFYFLLNLSKNFAEFVWSMFSWFEPGVSFLERLLRAFRLVEINNNPQRGKHDSYEV
eukprot:m.56506 g.56506  ORF g.56506 m.56506 type:complete len:520 (+) comp7801_c2_seq1:2656-4215(+)